MFRKIIISLLLLLVLMGCEDKEPSQQVLKVATSGDNPPYEFYENGQLTGFDIELMRKIAAQLGKSVEFIDMDFGGIIAALQSRRVDVAIAAFTPTQERRKTVDFSDAYYEAIPAFITLQGVSNMSSSALQHKVIGVQMGSTHEKVAQKIAEQERSVGVISLNKIPDLIQALKTHRLDTILIGSTEAQAIVQADADLSAHLAKDLPVVDTGNAIALPKGSPLKEPIDKALQVLEKDNVLASLKKQWGLK